jgi:hypothetical protein
MKQLTGIIHYKSSIKLTNYSIQEQESFNKNNIDTTEGKKKKYRNLKKPSKKRKKARLRSNLQLEAISSHPNQFSVIFNHMYPFTYSSSQFSEQLMNDTLTQNHFIEISFISKIIAWTNPF